MKRLVVSMVLTAVVAVVPCHRAGAGEKFACDLHALTATERARHQELTRALLVAVAEKSELRNGFGFRLSAKELLIASEWMGLEARCCPFFTFELEQTRDRGPLWLRITGTDGVKPFIRAEFGI